MKKAFIIIALFSNIIWSEEFISQYEYGQMLYANPRGVSCQKCHGKVGKRNFIASFKEKNGSIRKFFAPDIRNLTLKQFSNALKSGGKIMPRYYLTKKEIEAIYKYIQIVNKPVKTEIVQEANQSKKVHNNMIENIETFSDDIEENITQSDFYEEEGIEIEGNSSVKMKNINEYNENSSIIFKLFNDLKKDEEQ